MYVENILASVRPSIRPSLPLSEHVIIGGSTFFCSLLGRMFGVCIQTSRRRQRFTLLRRTRLTYALYLESSNNHVPPSGFASVSWGMGLSTAYYAPAVFIHRHKKISTDIKNIFLKIHDAAPHMYKLLIIKYGIK